MANYTLPVFEDLTRDFNDAFSHRVATVTRSDGLLSKINAHVIHEGKSSTFVSAEGNQREMNPRKAEATTTIHKDEIEKISVERVLQTINELAEQFKRDQSKMLFETMQEATTETGNVVDGQGKPLSNDLILEAMEKMQHEFDEAGEPTFSFVVHPDMLPRLAQMQNEYDNDPELRKRHEQLIARKRDEFRSREMDRNLAG